MNIYLSKSLKSCGTIFVNENCLKSYVLSRSVHMTQKKYSLFNNKSINNNDVNGNRIVYEYPFVSSKTFSAQANYDFTYDSPPKTNTYYVGNDTKYDDMHESYGNNADNSTVNEIENVKEAILKSKDIETILKTLYNIENMDVVGDLTIYSKAMRHIKNITNDSYNIELIFKLLLNQSIKFGFKLDVYIFNVYFNCNIKSGNIGKSMEYFNFMIKDFKVLPNNDTFTILLKLCRKNSDTKLAEWLWTFMTDGVQLNPTINNYVELLNVNKFSNDKLDDIFNKFLSDNNINLYDYKIWYNYLDIYSDKGNSDKVFEIINIMNEMYSIPITINVHNYVLNCYLKQISKSRDYSTRVNISKKGLEYIATNIDCDINETTLYYKTLLYLNIMNSKDINDTIKDEYFIKINEDILDEYKENKLTPNDKYFRAKFESYILKYNNTDINKITTEFKDMLYNKRLKYLTKENNDNIYAIDIHNYSVLTSQYILYYILQYKLSKFKKKNQNKIYIYTGYVNQRQKLQEFVINFFESLNPSILCQIDSNDKNRIIIKGNEYKKLIKTEFNFFDDPNYKSLNWKIFA